MTRRQSALAKSIKYGETQRTIAELSVKYPAIGAQRACPDCGRPQHYTGTEYGWAHDALVDTWHCAGDRVRANKTSEAGA